MKASQIATPPSIAVGFLCQRSVFGFATMPERRARARTSGVSASAKLADTAAANRFLKVNGMNGGKWDYILSDSSVAGKLVDQWHRDQASRAVCFPQIERFTDEWVPFEIGWALPSKKVGYYKLEGLRTLGVGTFPTWMSNLR